MTAQAAPPLAPDLAADLIIIDLCRPCGYADMGGRRVAGA